MAPDDEGRDVPICGASRRPNTAGATMIKTPLAITAPMDPASVLHHKVCNESSGVDELEIIAVLRGSNEAVAETRQIGRAHV